MNKESYLAIIGIMIMSLGGLLFLVNVIAGQIIISLGSLILLFWILLPLFRRI